MINSNDGFRMTDHPNLYNKALTIIKRKGFELFLWPAPKKNISLGTFIASKENCDFFAEDPLRLIGMITIWEELGNDWYTSPEFSSENILNQLQEEAYPDSHSDYDNFDDEQYSTFVKKFQYFFQKDYMPDIEIKKHITKGII
jgi:hypothetical protein